MNKATYHRGALGVLQVLLDAEGALTTAQIQSRLGRSQSNVSAALRRLGALGWVHSLARGEYQTRLVLGRRHE